MPELETAAKETTVTSPSTPDTSLDPSWGHFVDGLRAFIARRVPAQDAEDVAQDALLRIHKSAATLRLRTRELGWPNATATIRFLPRWAEATRL